MFGVYASDLFGRVYYVFCGDGLVFSLTLFCGHFLVRMFCDIFIKHWVGWGVM